MRIDPSITSAALAALETSINKALQYDPASQLALEKLSGQVLQLHIQPMQVNIYCLPHGTQLTLLGHYEGQVHSKLSGSITNLCSLVFSRQASLSGSGVDLIGSTSLLIQWQQLFSQLELDWEQAIADVFGDIIGHSTAETLRAKTHWGKDRMNSAKRLTREFLQQEVNALPSRPEVEDFFQNIDRLNLDTDRIEAKFNALKQKMADIQATASNPNNKDPS